MRELDKVLGSREKVFWEGKPKFWPFVFGGFTVGLFGLFFMLIGLFSILVGLQKGNWAALIMPHFWVGLLVFIGVPLYALLVHKRVHYAITDKRVIIQKGLIGRDFEIIDYDQITNAEVNVGIIDKLFGRDSGSILISTAGSFTYTRQGPVQKPYTLSHIKNPYQVFKFFKDVSHDIKTDINYPNKYRPRTNPGYRTGYSPKRK